MLNKKSQKLTKKKNYLFGNKIFSIIKFITNSEDDEELNQILWLSIILLLIIGGYWLLASLKDAIMSSINGVEYIPQAKILSLIVVFSLVLLYNKLLDVYKKHHIFYIMSLTYSFIFIFISILLLHPTIGIENTVASPYRLLGWISYVSIESFGSMVVQCYWALINNSVDSNFAKKNFGKVIAGAQIGSILGPTLATQAFYTGIPMLYLLASFIIIIMVYTMYQYISYFVNTNVEEENNKGEKKIKNEGIMEGLYLFYKYNFVKGIYILSSFYLIQFTIVDYIMKVLARKKFSLLYPNDPDLYIKHFTTFMGHFGQATNSITLIFSYFGTGIIIEKFGLSNTLVLFPALLLTCSFIIWVSPTIYSVFIIMILMKGISYALNNPTKEILYHVTSTPVKFKCKSWIDTLGQRGAKASGSVITGYLATNLTDLVNYGSLTSIATCIFLIIVSYYMGKEYNNLDSNGIKVGEEEYHMFESELTEIDDKEVKFLNVSDDEEIQNASESSLNNV